MMSSLQNNASVLQLITNNPIGDRGHEKYLISHTASPFAKQFVRTTNYALDTYTLRPTGGGRISARQAVVDIPKTADLLGGCFISISLPGLINVGTLANSTTPQTTSEFGRPSWVEGVACRIVKQASIRIGEQDIETVFSEQIFMFMLLNGQELRSKAGFYKYYGPPAPPYFENTGIEQKMRQHRSQRFQVLHLKLPFSLGSHPSLFLPVCAIQYHGVQLSVQFNSNIESLIDQYNRDDPNGAAYNVKTRIMKGQATYDEALAAPANLDDSATTNSSQPEITASHVKASIDVDMVLLDKQEREEVASSSCEMVILNTDMHKLPGASTYETIDLPFNNSVVEILFAARLHSSVKAKEYFNFGGWRCPLSEYEHQPIIKHARLLLNNLVRIDREESWYRTVHAASVGHNVQDYQMYVYPYSFALRPVDAALQFTGSLNFSRLDSAKLEVVLDKKVFDWKPDDEVEILVFGQSYNILTIHKGMATKKLA